MGAETNISWCDSTWNPIFGCSRVSAGCQNCYAEQVVAAMPRKFKEKNPRAYEFYSGLTKETTGGPRWTGVVKLHEERLLQPLRWRNPRRIFVNSLSDLFHESMSDGAILRIFKVMAKASQHTFLILTKRPARMLEWFRRWADTTGESPEPQLVRGPDAVRKAHPSPRGQMFASYLEAMGSPPAGYTWPTFDWAEEWRWLSAEAMTLPNVWLGVSVEDQKSADERIPLLLQTPAAVRFLSCEPLLGKINLEMALEEFQTLNADLSRKPSPIHWVIVGAESGPNHRPMELSWAQSLRDQCVEAGVAFFFKQQSATRAGQRPYLPDANGVNQQWHQFPGQLTPPQIAKESDDPK